MKSIKIKDDINYIGNPRLKSILEKAVLVGQEKESLKELKGLAATAGVEIEDLVIHRGDNINPAYYVGTGKLVEIKKSIINHGSNLVIFDNELSPAQFRNLEEKLNIKVIDRTQLILDIFAQHARTRESKLQVELAQLEYLLPRLKGKGTQLSRLAGGIGTRGPGESKLEIDRRRIEKKIYRLKNKLKDIGRNRQIQRKARKDPVIALVGYTNAGKSTLMNLLTGADTETADKLFATLDSTLRSINLPIGRKVIISDTVGFIRKLPHQLVASFRASLEEIHEADILVHVVDCSNSCLEQKIEVVNSVLQDLDVLNKDSFIVFNKADLVSEDLLVELKLRYPDSIAISALSGQGKNQLLNKISKIIKKSMTTVKLNIPYQEAHWLDKIHQQGKVIEENYLNDNITIKAHITDILARKLKNYK